MSGYKPTKNGYAPGGECSLCKGRCCREKGCCLSPEDMLLAMLEKYPIANVEKLLPFLQQEDNLYSIDFFNRPEGALYYLRMRHKNYTFIGADVMGECIALTKEGCSLSMKKRPKGGRFLESMPDGHCIQHYSKEQMVEDWLPYQKILKSIWDEYYDKFMSDGTFDKCDEANFAWMKAQRETK